MNAATLARARRVDTYTYGGRTFRCSAYVAAALERTVRALAREHPGARLRVIQGCYNRGVAASAGTHDEDCCLDVEIVGMPGGWDASVLFLRRFGWAAFHRTPAQGFGHHIHMALIPPGLSANPTEAGVLAAYRAIGLEVGVFVPGQIDDFYNDALGLKGQHGYGTDHDPRPAGPINDHVFDFEAWERELEDEMAGPASWTDDDWAAYWSQFSKRAPGLLAAKLARAVWGYKLPGLDGVKVGASVLLNRANDVLSTKPAEGPKDGDK